MARPPDWSNITLEQARKMAQAQMGHEKKIKNAKSLITMIQLERNALKVKRSDNPLSLANCTPTNFPTFLVRPFE